MHPQTLQRLSALYGLTAVGMGAFGAHGLQSRNVAPRLLDSWKTASAYLLAHAVAMLVLSGRPPRGATATEGVGRWTAELFAVGAAMFSGSIYGLVLGNANPEAGQMGFMRKILGPMTPIGGSLMILGWASMLF